jgi:hypothetical protein
MGFIKQEVSREIVCKTSDDTILISAGNILINLSKRIDNISGSS